MTAKMAANVTNSPTLISKSFTQTEWRLTEENHRASV